MADEIHIVGVAGGEVQNSHVAGVVHGGMGNTTHNRHEDDFTTGDRTIQSSGNIGNIATGDNHSGHMTATLGSRGQKKALEDVTEDDVVEILKEKKLGKYEGLFRERGIDGSLLQKLTDERLSKFGVTDEWDRERILNLKKHLPK